MAYVPLSSIVAVQANPSVLQAVVLVTNPVSTLSVNPTPSSVLVLNPVSTLSVNPNPSSVYVINPVSILATTQSGTRITSLVSTIPSSVLVGASIIGLTPVAVTNTPSISGDVRIIGSVVTTGGTAGTQYLEGAVQSSVTGNAIMFRESESTSVIGTVSPTTPLPIVGSVSGSVGIVGNPSISGTVNTLPLGTIVTSLVSTIPSSVIVGTSIFGQLPAGTAPLGSVAVLQGTNPWIQTFSNSSILAVPIGSVITVLQSSSIITLQQAQSIVGTYSEDTGHTTADKGIFILGVRNDAIASFVSANLEYTPKAVDSAGRTLIKPFSPEDGTIISYTGSVVSGSVTQIAASAIGMRNYITDFWVANTGSVSTLITFQDGSTSILGRTIAPAGGGSNSPGIAIPFKTAPSQDLAFLAGTSTSVLYMTVKGYQAP